MDVLVEKPIAANLNEAEQLLALAEVQGLAIVQELVRAKSTIDNEDEAGLRLLAARIEEQFDEIERR